MLSADSEATVTSMLDAAVEKGLEGVCITDHMDPDFPETPDFPANAFQFDLDEYFGQLNRLKEQYKGKLDLRIRSGDWASEASWRSVSPTDRSISL